MSPRRQAIRAPNLKPNRPKALDGQALLAIKQIALLQRIVRTRFRQSCHRQLRVATRARSDPAARQPRERTHRPRMGPTRHATWVGHHRAAVAVVVLAPPQRHAGARPAPGHHHPERTGFGQAAQPTAIAGRALGRLGGRIGVQPDDGRGRRGLGHGPCIVRGARRGGPQKSPLRPELQRAEQARKPGAGGCNEAEWGMRDQHPSGRLGRMGTMPVTRRVLLEPSVAVSVLLVKRTWSLSRATTVSVASALAYSLPSKVMNTL